MSSLIVDGANQRATTLPIPRVVTRDLSTHLSPVHVYDILSQCRFSTPTPRQLMVELFVCASSRFPLRKSEEKLTPIETRTHKFRLHGRKLYPLDHGGSSNIRIGLKHLAVRRKRSNGFLGCSDGRRPCGTPVAPESQASYSAS